MRWVRRNLALPGPRAPKCRPRKRSLTPSAAAANASGAQQRLGIADPAELDVVGLVREGRAKGIAARLFVSPRTFQAHLTHSYTKLGLTSRVQLAQEAARRA